VRLAQVEIDWSARRFAACPPVLCQLPHHPHLALVSGAQTTDLIERLGQAASELGLEADLLFMSQERRGPDGVVVEAHPEDLARLAAHLQLPLIGRVAETIAAWLEGIDSSLLPIPALPDPRHPATPVWPGTGVPRQGQAGREDEGGPSNDGIWIIAEHGRVPVTWIRREGAWLRVSEREWAPYLAWEPGQEPLCAYDSQALILRTLAGAPLPPLASRAAVMCSGRLPRWRFDRERLEPPPEQVGPAELYANVPPEVARAILRHLGQPLPEEFDSNS
jgi:hypothetical protein